MLYGGSGGTDLRFVRPHRRAYANAYRRSSARLALVVKPVLAGSLPVCVNVGENFGAGDGNRTRIKSLGSSHSTIELHLHHGR